MSENKHTLGPWEVGGAMRSSDSFTEDTAIIEVTDSAGGFVACVSDTVDGASSDARLIAAAPDLLAACEAVLEHCALVHKYWGDNNNQANADKARRDLKAAIAKARGEG